MEYNLVCGYDRLKEVEELFTEYTNMLVRLDPLFQESLDEQNYSEELNHLEDKYGLPQGRLYLLMDGETPAASIALHKIDEKTCELKRLYVKPGYRRQGIAEKLLDRIIEEARETGYSYMVLDTMPALKEAIRLYEKKGFYRINKYNNNPFEKMLFYRKDL
ncbi:MAG: GNAT family N-acetyltransferase [Oscillospiraceae bacterium]|nr:GNAT family N-acetyltransferase [Oscillospiraceae bacterium]